MNIIDAAFRAGCPWHTCDVPNCQPECENYRISALEILRAALPWDLPADRLEAMAAAMIVDMFADHELPVPDDIWFRYVETARAAYRADPIFKELYPEEF